MGDAVPGRERLSAEALVAAPQPLHEEDVQIGEKGTIVVRALSRKARSEIMRAARGADGELDEEKLDLLLVQRAVVDPVLTEEQVAAMFEQWDAGDVDALMQGILRATGMLPGFARESAVRFREAP